MFKPLIILLFMLPAIAHAERRVPASVSNPILASVLPRVQAMLPQYPKPNGPLPTIRLESHGELLARCGVQARACILRLRRGSATSDVIFLPASLHIERGEGAAMLAHELAHWLQWSAGRFGYDMALEREAREVQRKFRR